MSTKHYKDQMSAFVDQELSKEDRQIVAEHLLRCDACRREHDAVRLGAGLAAKLDRADAPENVWLAIEAELDGRQTPRLKAFSQPRRFDLRHVGAFATAILAVGLLSFLVYRGLFTETGPTVVENQQQTFPESGPIPITSPETTQPTNINGTNTNEQLPINANSAQTETSGGTFWAVETIAGTPQVGEATGGSKLEVGEYLETDASSRARIEVAEIGDVEIAPNSRVKLVGTSDKQHRLSLERGQLYAKILAPPRLFIVDTPSAVAVDLGCEYTLEVDKAGNSKLTVTSGFVALERGGRESIVPAGASCLTMKGKGLGTPFSTEATPEFTRALRSFDFAGGGSRAVNAIIAEADLYDIITLWHLLSRVSAADRPAVYDALAKFVPAPTGVTRDGILALDKTMLQKWRDSVETTWFE